MKNITKLFLMTAVAITTSCSSYKHVNDISCSEMASKMAWAVQKKVDENRKKGIPMEKPERKSLRGYKGFSRDSVQIQYFLDNAIRLTNEGHEGRAYNLNILNASELASRNEHVYLTETESGALTVAQRKTFPAALKN